VTHIPGGYAPRRDFLPDKLECADETTVGEVQIILLADLDRLKGVVHSRKGLLICGEALNAILLTGVMDDIQVIGLAGRFSGSLPMLLPDHVNSHNYNILSILD